MVVDASAFFFAVLKAQAFNSAIQQLAPLTGKQALPAQAVEVGLQQGIGDVHLGYLWLRPTLLDRPTEKPGLSPAAVDVCA